MTPKNSSKKFGPLFVSFRCNLTNIGFYETKKTRNEKDWNFFPKKKSAFEVFLFYFFCKKDKNEIENKTKQGPISKRDLKLFEQVEQLRSFVRSRKRPETTTYSLPTRAWL